MGEGTWNSPTAHAPEGGVANDAGGRTLKSNGKVETSDRGGRAEIEAQVLSKFTTLKHHIKCPKTFENIKILHI
jgi:hypothetical protein